MKDRIAKIMNMENLSQKDFAEWIETNPATLSNIFSEKSKPSLPIILKIHEKFPAISLDWILTGTGSMYADASNAPSGDIDAVSEVVSQDAAQSPSLGGTTALSAGNASRTGVMGVGVVSSPSSYDSSCGVKNIDKSMRKVMEIRVFYDDNTFESFVPKK